MTTAGSWSACLSSSNLLFIAVPMSNQYTSALAGNNPQPKPSATCLWSTFPAFLDYSQNSLCSLQTSEALHPSPSWNALLYLIHLSKLYLFFKIKFRDFPGGPVVKNLPSSAGDVDSIPGQGTKIPHATGQLSPRATSTELTCLSERARVPQLQSPRALEPMCLGARVP